MNNNGLIFKAAFIERNGNQQQYSTNRKVNPPSALLLGNLPNILSGGRKGKLITLPDEKVQYQQNTSQCHYDWLLLIKQTILKHAKKQKQLLSLHTDGIPGKLNLPALNQKQPPKLRRRGKVTTNSRLKTEIDYMSLSPWAHKSIIL